MYRTLLFAALILCLARAGSAAADPHIELRDGVFVLTGLADPREPPAGWKSVFSLSTAAENAPPMLGTYMLDGAKLLFTPRFPLAAGVRYHAVYRSASGPIADAWFDGPSPSPAVPTQVNRVYPSAGVWPSNTLRFYIHFSAAMRRGDGWRHIHLLDDAGQIVPLAFLEIDQELWDPSNQRLTVLFDPGRIKRGVRPEREIGPPLVEGRQYTILIDAQLPDASGRPLAQDFRKTFRAGAPVRSAIDPREWRLTVPPAATTQPLDIAFPRPLDHALLERSLTIRAASSSAGIEGVIVIDREEMRWRFTPDRAWAPGDYELIVEPELEDVAGNRVDRPFEIGLNRPAPDPARRRLRFRVQP